MAEDGGGYKGTFPRECLIQIFSQLPPASLALCMVVNKQWRDILVAEEGIWRDRCRVVYGYHGDSQHSSFRALCGLWHPICAKYGVMALSMLHSFGRIKAWLAENAPQVAESLRPGATEADLAQAEAQLDVRFPAPLRILYRMHDGQELEFDRRMDMRRPAMGPSVFHGLFGG
jgi:hypothetical protein